MNIIQALQIKVSDVLRSDTDRFVKVRYAPKDAIVHTNIYDVQYIWIGTDKGVWPSNRLSYKWR